MNILLAKLRTKKTSPKIGPLKAPFICVKFVAELFTDKESILKSFAGLFFATAFQPFWRGIERLQVFLWPLGKRRITSLQTSPLNRPPKRSVETPHLRVVCCGVRHGATSRLQGQTCVDGTIPCPLPTNVRLI